MTIFVSMILLLIVSLLLTFLESSRVYGLKAMANNVNTMSMESTFASYQKQLLEEYDVMFLDGSDEEGSFDLDKINGELFENADDNLNLPSKFQLHEETNLFHFNAVNTQVEKYELATDQDKTVFYQQAIEAMKQRAGYDIAAALKNQIDSVNDPSADQTTPEIEMKNAQEEISLARTQRQAKADEEKKPVVISEEEKRAENPLDFVVKLKERGILGLVVDEPEKLSENTLSENTNVTGSDITGTLHNTYQSDSTDKLWFQYYINQHFGNYTAGKEGTKLKYEQEYLIGGKNSDTENLKEVVDKLLLIREALNFGYLMTDAAKMEEAEGLATALVGFTGNILIIQAVQVGILAAWAFVESIIDVRQLLKGSKIAPIKTQTTWNTDILHISDSFENSKNKKSDSGFTYQQYLHALLFLGTKEQLLNRTLNLIEQNIRLQINDSTFQMNHMIQSLEVSYEYEASPLYSEVLVMTRNKLPVYQFQYVKEFSYNQYISSVYEKKNT